MQTGENPDSPQKQVSPKKKVTKEKKPKEDDMSNIAFFNIPKHLDCFTEPADAVFAAADYSYALFKNGNKLYSWGRGDNYVLGTREEDNLHKPEIVNPKMFQELPVLMMGTGSNHVVALVGDEADKKDFLP